MDVDDGSSTKKRKTQTDPTLEVDWEVDEVPSPPKRAATPASGSGGNSFVCMCAICPSCKALHDTTCPEPSEHWEFSYHGHAGFYIKSMTAQLVNGFGPASWINAQASKTAHTKTSEIMHDTPKPESGALNIQICVFLNMIHTESQMNLGLHVSSQHTHTGGY